MLQQAINIPSSCSLLKIPQLTLLPLLITGGRRLTGPSSAFVLLEPTRTSRNRSSKYPKEAALSFPRAASLAVACTLSSLPALILSIQGDRSRAGQPLKNGCSVSVTRNHSRGAAARWVGTAYSSCCVCKCGAIKGFRRIEGVPCGCRGGLEQAARAPMHKGNSCVV